MLATANTGKIGRGFGKNAGEWTGSVEIRKEEIPGSKRSMYGYILTYSRLKKERLSSVFSPDGTLISASAAPHCGSPLHERTVFDTSWKAGYLVLGFERPENRTGSPQNESYIFKIPLYQIET